MKLYAIMEHTDFSDDYLLYMFSDKQKAIDKFNELASEKKFRGDWIELIEEEEGEIIPRKENVIMDTINKKY